MQAQPYVPELFMQGIQTPLHMLARDMCGSGAESDFNAPTGPTTGDNRQITRQVGMEVDTMPAALCCFTLQTLTIHVCSMMLFISTQFVFLLGWRHGFLCRYVEFRRRRTPTSRGAAG